MASHMDGINSLPRWDPSNPTTYNYDWRTYDRADYAKFKQARLDFIAKRDAGKPSLEQAMKNLNQTIKQTIGDKLAEEMGEKKKKPNLSEIRKAAKEGKMLSASLPSTCFSELTWQDGIATGTFINKTAGDWSWECDLETFIEWVQSGSLGEFFNEEIR